MRECFILSASEDAAQESPLPHPELKRLARRAGDGVFGDRHEVFGKVGNNVAEASA
jgi:hypothetical protein